MKAALRLGWIAGVELVADVSMLVVAGVLGWAHSVTIDSVDPGAMVGLLGVVAAAGYVGSLVVHEATHSELARRRGFRPRRIRLMIFGGYTAIDDREFTPTDEFWVALSGSAASLVTGAILWGLSLATGFSEGVSETLRLLGVLNIVIALFNVLPGIPLDGGRALHAVLWRTSGDRVTAAQRSAMAGRVLGLFVAGAGLVMLVALSDLVGFVLLALGWVLHRSATVAGKREELIARSAGARVRDIMRPTSDAVPGPMRVAEVVSLFQSGPTLRPMPVEVDGRVTGIIGQEEIEELAPGRRELGRADSVMTPIGPEDLIDADAPIDVVLTRLDERLVVVEDGVAVGMIEQRDIEANLAVS